MMHAARQEGLRRGASRCQHSAQQNLLEQGVLETADVYAHCGSYDT